jgi:murein DD-endopeptidase MepM/ murein hydrolase activator NlpD
MKLTKPWIGDFKLGQRFGENYNPSYLEAGQKGHEGLDIPMPNGTPIVASCDGKVISISTKISRGEGVTILSDEVFQWNGLPCKFQIVYWHMMDKSIKVGTGNKVTRGQVLGLSNNTGNSTGPHLHFQIRPMSVDGKRQLDSMNGYAGCIDPLPWLDLPDAEGELQKKFNTSLESIAAIRVFQMKHGLAPDGVIGPVTRTKLML